MISSIELQVISKILTSDDSSVITTLCSYDSSYYSVFTEQIEFILNHKQKYQDIPDVFTFQAEFPDITLVTVNEPIDFLVDQLKKNKSQIILLETFNKLKDLGSGDVYDAWQYLNLQCERAAQLSESRPLDVVHDAEKRAEQIIEFNQQKRIPTGFAEIDKLMYGGLSTVEELLLIVARTNSGKSWICTRMMETAQKNGFSVLYYSPEMQAAFLGTRFDTWRQHFQNNLLYQGKYTEEYLQYLKDLQMEDASAFILEDKDVSEGSVSVNVLRNLVREHNIKLLIIDGLSYMSDGSGAKSESDYIKYKNLCLDLFKLSKQFGCAVVVSMQANRDTKDTKDDKGEGFPTLYNIEGSDHPARIATQAFSIRQVFDKHVLDIRLEKSRMANNQKPVLSYAWDVNTGNVRYLPGEDSDTYESSTGSGDVHVDVSSIITSDSATPDTVMPNNLDDSEFRDDIEF